MSETKSILKITLDGMYDDFTSNEFVRVAKENGYRYETNLHQERLRLFLLSTCKQVARRRWQKLGIEKPNTQYALHEEECINYLKSKGYKIMKPEFIEI